MICNVGVVGCNSIPYLQIPILLSQNTVMDSYELAKPKTLTKHSEQTRSPQHSMLTALTLAIPEDLGSLPGAFWHKDCAAKNQHMAHGMQVYAIASLTNKSHLRSCSTP